MVGYLSDFHGIDVKLDVRALTDAGIKPDKPITTSLKGISLRSALRLLLKEHDMAFTIREGVLLITTPDNAMETKIYPVRDLVLPPNPTAETRPDFKSLMALIEMAAEPRTWDDAGGIGTISAFENNLTLVVFQTEDVHEKIEAFLSL